MSNQRDLRTASDSELYEAWLRGDKKAGSELVQRYQRLLANFFRRKLDAPHEVEDAIQQTLTTFFTGHHREVENVRGYLFGIARHMIARRYQKHRWRAHDALLEDFPSPLDHPEMVVIEQESFERLAEARLKLPLDYQALLKMYYDGELTAQECAKQFGVPVSTLWSRLRLAKDALARELSPRSRAEKKH